MLGQRSARNRRGAKGMEAWGSGHYFLPELGTRGSFTDPVGLLALIILGFILTFDNFRVAVAVGALRPAWRRMLRTAVAFGVWDGFSPALGAVFGHYLARVGVIGEDAELLGAIGLAGYGLYLTIRSFRSDEVAELDERMAILGLPFFLSLDNLVAGTGLGLVGVNPVVLLVLFAGCTVVTSLVGLQMGKLGTQLLQRLVTVRADLVAGLGLLLSAGTLFVLH